MVHRVLSRLNKEDIGMPTNFQHISHVGWDPNHGFDLENVDPNLKKFFQKAGVDEKALQDKDTRDFIYDFIDKHGGVEAALREVNIHRTRAAMKILTHAGEYIDNRGAPTTTKNQCSSSIQTSTPFKVDSKSLR